MSFISIMIDTINHNQLIDKSKLNSIRIMEVVVLDSLHGCYPWTVDWPNHHQSTYHFLNAVSS